MARATFAIAHSGGGASIAKGFDQLANSSGFASVLEQNGAVNPDSVDIHARTGFVVVGGEVAELAWTDGVKARLERSTGSPVIRIEGDTLSGSSLAILLADGSGAILAIIPGYIGTVIIDGRGILSVSYFPSRESDRYPGPTEQARVQQLRVAAASATKFGVFRVESESEAFELASRIRVMKSLDPTLGLYAAYAFEQASKAELVRSVASFMLSDLEFQLFDVAMLARGGNSSPSSSSRVAPLCPMLTQGWSYLDVTHTETARGVREAGRYLRASLWTTFEPRGMEIVLGSGILKRG
jgi:hypothetical protein